MKSTYFHHQTKCTTRTDSKNSLSIQALEDQLALFQHRHEQQMQQFYHTTDKIDLLLDTMEHQHSKIFQKKIDKVEFQLTGMLEEEKQELFRRRVALKKFVQEKAVVVKQVIDEEMHQDQELTEEVRQVAASKLSALKGMISQSKNKNKNTSLSPNDSLQRKATVGLQNLGRQLTLIKKNNQAISKDAGKLTRNYLKCLQEIEQGKQDRQTKEEQLLAKIQELSGGDRTKEETVSRIQ